jgi:hypothetical protein
MTSSSILKPEREDATANHGRAHSTRPQSSTMAASFADTKSGIIHKNYINFRCNIRG